MKCCRCCGLIPEVVLCDLYDPVAQPEPALLTHKRQPDGQRLLSSLVRKTRRRTFTGLNAGTACVISAFSLAP